MTEKHIELDIMRIIKTEPWKLFEIFKEDSLKELFDKLGIDNYEELAAAHGYKKQVISLPVTFKFKIAIRDAGIIYIHDLVSALLYSNSVEKILSNAKISDEELYKFYLEVEKALGISLDKKKIVVATKPGALTKKLSLHGITNKDAFLSILNNTPHKLLVWFDEIELDTIAKMYDVEFDINAFNLRYGKKKLIELSRLNAVNKCRLLNTANIYTFDQLNKRILDKSIRTVYPFNDEVVIKYLFEDLTVNRYITQDNPKLWAAIQIRDIDIIHVYKDMKEALKTNYNVYDMCTLEMWWNNGSHEHVKDFTSAGIISIAKHFALKEMMYNDKYTEDMYLAFTDTSASGLPLSVLSFLLLHGFKYKSQIKELFDKNETESLMENYGFGIGRYNDFMRYFGKLYKEEN